MQVKNYVNNCSSCHVINLEGPVKCRSKLPNGIFPAPPHDQPGHTWHHSDNYLFKITKYGVENFIGEIYPNNIPAYEKILLDGQIISVLSYIKSEGSEDIIYRHNKFNRKSNAN